MASGKLHIGTSGWSYAHWAKGRFYPKGLKPGEWLRFYARHFTTVELNASFYRLPREEIVTRWRETVGPRFRFAVKLWRRITHEKRLADCRDELARFFAVAGEFGPKRGPLLVQLPPYMGKDIDLLKGFLADLRSVISRSRWRITVEFRNPTWLCDAVYDLLDRQRVALCLADLERCPITEPNNADFVYIRRHGPGGQYRGCYASQHIADDAERILRWLANGRDVFVYFNNDVEGHALDNAAQLMDALRQKQR